MTKTIFAKNKVYVADCKRPEYLDGAMMQFTVTEKEKYPCGRTLAYFDTREDALLFATAKALTKAHKCAKSASDTAD